jgi:adenosylmethionine-8-amino-7-oxononanoate aminotransferase
VPTGASTAAAARRCPAPSAAASRAAPTTSTQHVFASRPPAGFYRGPGDSELEAWTSETTRLFEQHAHELAAVVVEPVLQGAGGMHIYSPECLRVLRALCDEHGVLLLLDEIATGFGRTGTMLAAEHAKVVPDVLCLGKALTGGYLTMAAVLCTSAVAEAVCTPPASALMHGPTFMANPLACAVASGSIDLLLGQDWAGEVRRIETGLREGLAPAADLPGVADVRVLGAVGVVQTRGPADVTRARRPRSPRGCGCGPSATSSTRCRHTSAPTTTLRQSLAACSPR